MEENNDIFLDGVDALLYLGTTSIPNIPHQAKRQNDVFGSTHLPTKKTSGVIKYFFGYKTSYIGTIGNKVTAKGPTTVPW